MNLINEDDSSSISNYLKRRISPIMLQRAMKLGLHGAKNFYEKKYDRTKQVNIEKYKSWVVSITFDSIMHLLTQEHQEEIETSKREQIWDFLEQYLQEQIVDDYFEIKKKHNSIS